MVMVFTKVVKAHPFAVDTISVTWVVAAGRIGMQRILQG